MDVFFWNESWFSGRSLAQTSAAAPWSHAGWAGASPLPFYVVSLVYMLCSEHPKKCELSPFFLQLTLSRLLPKTNRNMPAHTRNRDRGGRKDLEGFEHASRALLAGECEVGVSLISNAHERLAPVCLAATSLSVCFISACQALSGLLVLLLLLGSGPGTQYTLTYTLGAGNTSILPSLSGMVLR